MMMNDININNKLITPDPLIFAICVYLFILPFYIPTISWSSD